MIAQRCVTHNPKFQHDRVQTSAKFRSICPKRFELEVLDCDRITLHNALLNQICLPFPSNTVSFNIIVWIPLQAQGLDSTQKVLKALDMLNCGWREAKGIESGCACS